MRRQRRASSTVKKVDQSKMKLHDDATFMYPAMYTETRRHHARNLLCFVETLVLPCQFHALASCESERVSCTSLLSKADDSVSRNAPALGRNGTIERTRNGCMIVWDVLSLFPVKPLVA
jgi:hypothetical protein